MRQFTKLLTMLILLLLPIPLFAACSKQPAQKPKPKEVVGVSLADAKGADGKAIKKAVESKDKEIKLLFKDAANSAAQQEKDVLEMLDQKAKVIVIEFVEPVAAASLAQKVMEQGVKLLALNVLPENVPLDGFIGPDYTRVGALQAQYILNGQKQLSTPVALALLEENTPVGEAVLTGQSGVFSDDISVVESRIAADNPGMIETGVMEATAANKTAGAVTTSSPRLTKGLLKGAIDPAVITVGTGITKESAQAIKMGIHDADVDLMPDLVGMYAAKAVSELLANGVWEADTMLNNGSADVPATIVPVRLITGDNLFLLQQRLGKIEAKPTGQSTQSGGESDQGGQQGSQSGGQAGKAQGQQGGGTKLIIETTDGKKMELQIDGEIKSVQMQKGGGQQKQGGEDGGGQQDSGSTMFGGG